MLEIDTTAELAETECHEFDELYLVDLKSKELKRRTANRRENAGKGSVAKLKIANSSSDAYLSFGLDLI